MPDYELIGAWKASKQLPKKGRAALRRYLEFLNEGIVPKVVILSDRALLNVANRYLERGATPAEAYERTFNVAFDLFLPKSGNGGAHTYIDSFVQGGTIPPVADPFVPIGNLYNRANFPVRDYSVNPPQHNPVFGPPSNPLVMEEAVTLYGNGDAWWANHPLRPEVMAEWRKLGFHVGNEIRVKPVETYRFRLIIDWQKKHAGIEPREPL